MSRRSGFIAGWKPRGSDGRVVSRNVSWLLADRLFRLVVGLVINVWMVRYLGAADLGLLGFTQSLVGLFAILSSLGLESIIVRELVGRPAEAGLVLGSSLGLRLAGGALTVVLAAVTMMAIRPGNGDALALALIFGAVTVAQTLDVIEYWFQSRSRVAPFVLARAGAFVLASIAKVVCLASRAPLGMIAAAIAGEFVLAAVGLAIAYRLGGGAWATWRFLPGRARSLLADSWPLLLSGVAILVYTRTDQVMLTLMRGEAENGIYAAAQRLSEILYFVPVAAMAASNPALLRSHAQGAREYERRLGRLFTALAWVAILLAVPVSILSGWVTTRLFGAAFQASGPVLALHVWAAPAVFLGVAQTNWFIAKGRQTGLLLRTLVGALANVALNFWLIPPWGAAGAAVATLVSQWLASILLNSMFPSTRGLFRLQCRAFLPVAPR